jgi:FKBP12-rapamycin complex-associated protein
MRVLREERDCLLTVLEAFVHDPLLTWRLTTTAEPARARNDAAAVVAAAGGHSIIATSMRFAPRGFGMSVAQSVARLPGAMSYSVRARVGDIAADAAAASTRAQEVVQRIQEKLTGMEASANPTTAHLEQKPAAPRSVREQVAMLVSEASSAENLSQMYHGWCAFW